MDVPLRHEHVARSAQRVEASSARFTENRRWRPPGSPRAISALDELAQPDHPPAAGRPTVLREATLAARIIVADHAGDPETITLYSANQILAEALARHLVTSHTTRKYVYTTLIEYFARTLDHRPRARC